MCKSCMGIPYEGKKKDMVEVMTSHRHIHVDTREG